MKTSSTLVLCVLLIACMEDLRGTPIERYADPFERVTLGKLEWIAYMTHKESLFTGVLVSDKHILTSAHALHNKDTSCFKAVFKNAREEFIIKVKRFIIHPKYDDNKPPGYDHDFAIAELNESVYVKNKSMILPKIDPRLYTFDELINISPVYAAGYARRGILRQVQLNWDQVYEPSVIPNIYHLSYSGNGEHGDSGGPLFYDVNHERYILGIADSVSELDSEINFQPISTYLSFISNHTSLIFSDIGISNSPDVNWKSVHCNYEVDLDKGLGIAFASVTVLVIGSISTYLIWRKVKTKLLTN